MRKHWLIAVLMGVGFAGAGTVLWADSVGGEISKTLKKGYMAVKLEEVPAAVRTTIKNEAGDNVIDDLSSYSMPDHTWYRADFKDNGRAVDLRVNDQGILFCKRMTLPLESVPVAAKEGILKASGEQSITDVNLFTFPDRMFYEAPYKLEGKEAFVRVTPDGKLEQKRLALSFDQAPTAVRDTLSKEAGSNKIARLDELTWPDNSMTYRGVWEASGRHVMAIINPSGGLISRETCIPLKEAPTAVGNLLTKESGGAKPYGLREVVKSDVKMFQAYYFKDGKKTDLTVSPEGKSLPNETLTEEIMQD